MLWLLFGQGGVSRQRASAGPPQTEWDRSRTEIHWAKSMHFIDVPVWPPRGQDKIEPIDSLRLLNQHKRNSIKVPEEHKCHHASELYSFSVSYRIHRGH